MDQLQTIYRDVKYNIDNNIDCDRDIFIVLNSGDTLKDSSHCGHHLITILEKVQKSAKLEKRADFPNLVLLQYYDEVPHKADNVVRWNCEVFNEKLTDKLESITKLFDDPSVRNPFGSENGKLTNNYGPEQQFVPLDEILMRHEQNHKSREFSVQQVVQIGSKVFSQFQNFIVVVLLSKYCDECLLVILNHLTSLTLVKKFVWNLGRGVWCPRTRKSMNLCFSWVGDDGKLYKPSCWRSPDMEEIPARAPPPAITTALYSPYEFLTPTPPRTITAATSSSNKTSILPGSSSKINRKDTPSEPEDYIGELSSSSSSDDEKLKAYRKRMQKKKNSRKNRKSKSSSDDSDDNMGYQKRPKNNKMSRILHEKPLKQRSIEVAYREESYAKPMPIKQKRQIEPKVVKKVAPKPTNKEMHDAYIQLHQCFIDAPISNLPLERETSDFFCAFCFSFQSNSDHFCSALTDAEKMANSKVNEIMKSIKTLDEHKFEGIKMFLADEKDIWRKREEENKGMKTTEKKEIPAELMGRMARRTGKPEKYYGSDEEKTKKSDRKAKRKRNTSRRPKDDSEDSEDSDDTPSKSKKIPSSSASSSLALRSTSEVNQIRYSETGRPLRKVREVPRWMEPSTSDFSQIQRPRKKKIIYPNDYVPPALPKNRPTWSREDYRRAQFGPVYSALHEFRPDFLEERSGRSIKLRQIEWSDSENEEEERIPEKRSSQKIPAKRYDRNPASDSESEEDSPRVTKVNNYLPALKRYDTKNFDYGYSMDSEENPEGEGPSTLSDIHASFNNRLNKAFKQIDHSYAHHYDNNNNFGGKNRRVASQNMGIREDIARPPVFINGFEDNKKSTVPMTTMPPMTADVGPIRNTKSQRAPNHDIIVLDDVPTTNRIQGPSQLELHKYQGCVQQ